MSRSISLLVFGLMVAFFGAFFAWPIWETVKVAVVDAHGNLTVETIKS